MALPLILGGIGLGLNALNYFSSRSDQNRAQSRLDDLSKQPLARYRVTPEISNYYGMAVNMAANPMGFTQGERGAFTQNLNRGLNSQYTNATSMSGGNLSRAIGLMNTTGQLGALSDFAGRDAQLRRQYQQDALGRAYQGANTFQNVSNMNTSADINRQLEMLRAYGGAVQSNK